MTTVLTRDERQLLVAARRHLRADGWTLYSGGARHDGAHLDAEWAYEWNVDGKYGRILEIRLLTKHGSTRRVALTADVDSVREAIDIVVAFDLLPQGMSSQYKAGAESATPAQEAPASHVITIREIHDDQTDIEVNGTVVGNVNHDDHGWTGMEATVGLVRALGPALGAEVRDR